MDCWDVRGGRGGQGSTRMAVHRRRRGGLPPFNLFPPGPPPPQTKGTIVGKNEI